MSKIKNVVIDNIKFTPDCQNKWDFDGPIIVASSRGYNIDKKHFYVGYYLVAETDEDDGIYDTITIIEDELFARDFDALKVKVRKWYKKHFKEALEKASQMLEQKYISELFL